MNWKDMTIREIEAYLENNKVPEESLDELLQDERTGAVGLARRYLRHLEREQERLTRWNQLAEREASLRDKGYKYIAGIDEAGRGPLAGPVVAAAVILSPDQQLIGLDDSKKLTEQEREELFTLIEEKALAIGVGIVDSRIIDKINILQATYKAMQQAVSKLNPGPDYILVDGNREIPEINIKQEVVVDGDCKVNAIAAASIIAKVTRDRMLLEYHKKYPDYGFDSNKGYGTSQHIQALEAIGPCPIHRYTFSVVEKYYFQHVKESITLAKSALELKKIGETIANHGLFSEENLEILRELYRKQHKVIVSGG